MVMTIKNWTLTLRWAKGVSKQENGPWVTKHGYIKKLCEGCVLGKQAMTNFQKKAEYHARRPLELIHIDIWGSITPKSFSEKFYFIIFIGDYTRKIWVYFFKEKS